MVTSLTADAKGPGFKTPVARVYLEICFTCLYLLKSFLARVCKLTRGSVWPSNLQRLRSTAVPTFIVKHRLFEFHFLHANASKLLDVETILFKTLFYKFLLIFAKVDKKHEVVEFLPNRRCVLDLHFQRQTCAISLFTRN